MCVFACVEVTFFDGVERFRYSDGYGVQKIKSLIDHFLPFFARTIDIFDEKDSIFELWVPRRGQSI